MDDRRLNCQNKTWRTKAAKLAFADDSRICPILKRCQAMWIYEAGHVTS
jgi:hypothetical protein